MGKGSVALYEDSSVWCLLLLSAGDDSSARKSGAFMSVVALGEVAENLKALTARFHEVSER
jgi:hypothetical protein